MRTVGELMKILKEFDEDDIVIMSSDAEGNRYSPLASEDDAVAYGIYVPSTTWFGEVYDIDDQEQLSETEPQLYACILYPIN